MRTLKTMLLAGSLLLVQAFPSFALTDMEIQDLIQDQLDDFAILRADLEDQLDEVPPPPPAEFIAIQEEIQFLGARITQGTAVIPFIPFLNDEAIENILEYLGIEVSPA